MWCSQNCAHVCCVHDIDDMQSMFMTEVAFVDAKVLFTVALGRDVVGK